MQTRCCACGHAFETAASPGLKDACPRCLAWFVVAETDAVSLSPTPPEPSQDRPPLEPGSSFRGLEILEKLGEGGMGVVYKARQPQLDRTVAVKILNPKLASDPQFLLRFNREAKALASLSHPNIVQVFDFGREGELVFLVMEYVDGVSLREMMRGGKLTPEQALKIVPQICDALQYAHSTGVVHRDIKPENILVDRRGTVKVADFGLAKILSRDDPAPVTRTSLTLGTPHYMAPEQVENLKGVDHRADIYSLGVVIYEMLTGELPIGRFEPPSRRVQIDVRLDEVVLRALEKRPERRYQQAREVREDVTRITEEPLARPTPPTANERGAALFGYCLPFGALRKLAGENSPFVRFHAAQSLVLWGSAISALVILHILWLRWGSEWLQRMELGVLGLFAAGWLPASICAMRGKVVRLPFAARIARELAKADPESFPAVPEILPPGRPASPAPGPGRVPERLNDILEGRGPRHPDRFPAKFGISAWLFLPAILTTVCAALDWTPFLGDRGHAWVRLTAILSGVFILVALIWTLVQEVRIPSCARRFTPERAAAAFFNAIRWGYWKKAYSCLSPCDKTPALRSVPDLSPQVRPRGYSFNNLRGFRDYWKCVARTLPEAKGCVSGNAMRWTLHGIERISDRVVRLDVELSFLGYPAWFGIVGIALFILAPFYVLWILLFERYFRESAVRRVQKILYLHEGQWWFLNGELEGEEDRMPIPAS